MNHFNSIISVISPQEDFFLARNVYSFEKRNKEIAKKKKKEQKRLLKLERKMNKEGKNDPLTNNPEDSEPDQSD
jgi:hypothetical protein